MPKTLSISMIGLLLSLAPPSALSPTWAQGPNRLEKAASDVIAATLNYRAALGRVLAIHERDLARLAGMADLRQDLFEREVLSRREFEESRKATEASEAP